MPSGANPIDGTFVQVRRYWRGLVLLLGGLDVASKREAGLAATLHVPRIVIYKWPVLTTALSCHHFEDPDSRLELAELFCQVCGYAIALKATVVVKALSVLEKF
jgi:hypothetical protein